MKGIMKKLFEAVFGNKVEEIVDEKYVEPEYITLSRKKAKEYLGPKWVLHPDNAAVKKPVELNTLGK
jgi:hypothetical protein